MNHIRLFPRYDVRKLKSPIEIDYLVQEGWILKDIGLGGIQIRSPKMIQLEGENRRIKIKLFEKEEVLLSVTQCWSEERENEHLAGFKLYFEDLETFAHWRKILKALHTVLNKKKN